MFEIVMLFAFLSAVICPLLPAKPPAKRLPTEKAGSPDHGETGRALMAESAHRAMAHPRGGLTSRTLKLAHAA
jgi:hypothetical protein